MSFFRIKKAPNSIKKAPNSFSPELSLLINPGCRACLERLMYRLMYRRTPFRRFFLFGATASAGTKSTGKKNTGTKKGGRRSAERQFAIKSIHTSFTVTFIITSRYFYARLLPCSKLSITSLTNLNHSLIINAWLRFVKGVIHELRWERKEKKIGLTFSEGLTLSLLWMCCPKELFALRQNGVRLS